MRLISLMPIYQKFNTRRPAKGHKTHPYLLRELRVERPNQVWCVDIGLPLSGGLVSVLVHYRSWGYSWGGRRSSF